MIKAVAFPNLIQIGDPENTFMNIHHVDFTMEERSREDFVGALSMLDPKKERLRVTIVGLFETRTPLSDLVTVNAVHPKGLRHGFGDQNVAPAQILVNTIADIRFETIKESKPNQ
ncbi:MAG TPA: hypothetical protein VMH80_28290 [Bryobacteraceae bacterium]|nr:hypothetical protein [Bryobacteraceae bacterium]